MYILKLVGDYTSQYEKNKNGIINFLYILNIMKTMKNFFNISIIGAELGAFVTDCVS